MYFSLILYLILESNLFLFERKCIRHERVSIIIIDNTFKPRFELSHKIALQPWIAENSVH